MAVKVKVKTTGGKRIAAHLRKQAQRARSMPGEVTVGFEGPAAGVAARLEYGDYGIGLPERPVFRVASRKGGTLTVRVSQATRKVKGMPTPSQAKDIALEGARALRAAYRSATGRVPDVGERQRRRKRGTSGAGKTLVGTEGPVLISRIVGKVDGNKVGE